MCIRDRYNTNDVLYAQDHVLGEGELPPVRRFKYISPGSFATLGTRLVAGRDLDWTDIDVYKRQPETLPPSDWD